MAMDARGRASASRMLPAQGPVGIRPNGSIDQAGRQAIGWGYTGVVTGSPAVILGVITWVLPNRSVNWTLQSRGTTLTAGTRSATWTLESGR